MALYVNGIMTTVLSKKLDWAFKNAICKHLFISVKNQHSIGNDNGESKDKAEIRVASFILQFIPR